LRLPGQEIVFSRLRRNDRGSLENYWFSARILHAFWIEASAEVLREIQKGMAFVEAFLKHLPTLAECKAVIA